MTQQKKYKTLGHSAAQIWSILIIALGVISILYAFTAISTVIVAVAPVVDLLIICIAGIFGVIIIGAIIINLLIQIEQNTSATYYEAKKHILENEAVV